MLYFTVRVSDFLFDVYTVENFLLTLLLESVGGIFTKQRLKIELHVYVGDSILLLWIVYCVVGLYTVVTVVGLYTVNL